MKKLLFLFSVLFLCFHANAQMWCAPGATWHYRVYSPFMPYYDGHLKLTLGSTVTINNNTCYNINGNYTGKTWGPQFPVVTLGFINFQTYENNKVTYIYNTKSLGFDTIANFNASIGDKWLIIRFPFDTCANNPVRKPITVLDTGHVNINSINLKRITVSVPMQSSGSYTLNMIEKISSLSGFLFHSFENNCQTDGPVYGNFVCYSDNNFPLYNPSSTVCDYIPTALKENSFLNNSLKLFPNPNNGNFNIELDQSTGIKIYDQLGALVYEDSFKGAGNFAVNLSSLSQGIYSVKTENTNGILYSKFVKQ